MADTHSSSPSQWWIMSSPDLVLNLIQKRTSPNQRVPTILVSLPSCQRNESWAMGTPCSQNHPPVSRAWHQTPDSTPQAYILITTLGVWSIQQGRWGGEVMSQRVPQRRNLPLGEMHTEEHLGTSPRQFCQHSGLSHWRKIYKVLRKAILPTATQEGSGPSSGQEGTAQHRQSRAPEGNLQSSKEGNPKHGAQGWDLEYPN